MNVPLDQLIQHHRRNVAAEATVPFLRPRCFVSAESWTKAATDLGRYTGFSRDQEPDLPSILQHRRILILGGEGAGKSTAARASVQHVLGQPDTIPILASLKGFRASLRDLLIEKTPPVLLDLPQAIRAYALDGIDEVSSPHREALKRELTALITADANARFVFTSRQAFHALHPEAFPEGLGVYHLLDFDDKDIRAVAKQRGINGDVFLGLAREVGCREEISNPFVLFVMLERYQEEGTLSPVRSDNVGYMVDRLIHSRPVFHATRQRRALRMLATACETAARNELAEEEALRVLRGAIDIPEETARRLLEELSQSILIHTQGISFQMRSYGEYLAAEELHDKPIDRLKELAFASQAPLDSWGNTITYLAEMNDKIREYFIRKYPAWLINVSPAAFSEEERTSLTRRVLEEVNTAKSYLVNQQLIPTDRLARLLTSETIHDVEQALNSPYAHDQANALVLLGILGHRSVTAHALPLAIETGQSTPLRYSAIVALIQTGDHSVIDALIAALRVGDPLHVNLVDAIGSVCTPADFPRVLPILRRTNAMLSATFYHFREFRSQEALIAAVDYLTANPAALHGHQLNGYLEPLIDLIPAFWDLPIATLLGRLMVELERAHVSDGTEIVDRIVRHIGVLDHDGVVVSAAIQALAAQGTRLHYTTAALAALVNVRAAEWIVINAPAYAPGLALRLPDGEPRKILARIAADAIVAQNEARQQHQEEERSRGERIATIRAEHQETIRTAEGMNRIIEACERLPREHWPELFSGRREWLTGQVNNALARLDLAHNIRWQSENTWTQPHGLRELLGLLDQYSLRLLNDVPVVLALARLDRSGHQKLLPS